MGWRLKFLLRVRPAGYAPGEPRLAHWFPRSALETREFGSFEHTLAFRIGQRSSLGQQGLELVAMTRREVRVDDALMTETIYTFKRQGRTVNR